MECFILVSQSNEGPGMTGSAIQDRFNRNSPYKAFLSLIPFE